MSIDGPKVEGASAMSTEPTSHVKEEMAGKNDEETPVERDEDDETALGAEIATYCDAIIGKITANEDIKPQTRAVLIARLNGVKSETTWSAREQINILTSSLSTPISISPAARASMASLCTCEITSARASASWMNFSRSEWKDSEESILLVRLSKRRR